MLKVFCFACAYKSSTTLPSAIVILQPLLLFNAMKIMLLFYELIRNVVSTYSKLQFMPLMKSLHPEVRKRSNEL